MKFKHKWLPDDEMTICDGVAVAVRSDSHGVSESAQETADSVATILGNLLQVLADRKDLSKEEMEQIVSIYPYKLED